MLAPQVSETNVFMVHVLLTKVEESCPRLFAGKLRKSFNYHLATREDAVTQKCCMKPRFAPERTALPSWRPLISFPRASIRKS